MAGGRADTYDQRADSLARILAHNRLVSLLRIVVPALGLLAFVVLAGQIYLANIARQYGVSGIRIDRGDIVVETPQYSGTGADGSRYVVTAREARTPIDDRDRVDLIDATLELINPGKTSYSAETDTATMITRSDITTAPGLVTVHGSDGLEGTLNDVVVDSARDLVTSNGPVDLLLSDGTTIEGSTMVRDGTAQTWTFTQATVVVPDLPAAEE